MKKNKLFISLAVFGLLLTGLAACGGKSGEEQPSEEPGTTEPASQHNHKYGSWTTVTEATCSHEGLQERVCECGDKQTRPIDKLDHTWDAGTITKEATCKEPGKKLFTCTKCGEQKFEDIFADHTWGEAFEMPAYSTVVGYRKSECTECGEAYKLEIAAKDGTFSSGANNNAPDYFKNQGYVKFGSNNQSLSLSFQYNAPARGKIYLRGVMDHWRTGSNNETKTMFWGNNPTELKDSANFDLKVNDVLVDASAQKNVTFEEMLPGETQQSSYSPLGDCLVGEVTLKSGINTLYYERTQSYNLILKDFVIIVENTGDIVEPEEINEGYKVDFTVGEHCQLLVYEQGQAYEEDGVTPVEKTTTYTTDKIGVICKWTEAREALDNCPQVNVKIICEADYEVDADSFVIAGVFNKVKLISSDLSANSYIFRITKIHSDIQVTINPVQDTSLGRKITFNLKHCTVKVYIGKKNEAGDNLDAADEGGFYYTRSKDDPYDFSKAAAAQFNFEIVPDEGYEFNDGIDWPEFGEGVTEVEVSSSKCSFITPNSNYNKIKLLSNGSYNLTKVAGKLIINATATAVVA